MKKTVKFPFRLIFAGLLFLSVMIVLLYRVVSLQITQKAFLQEQGQVRAVREVSIPAYRGVIADRNREPLAISTPVDSIWVNPRLFFATDQKRRELARALNMPDDVLKNKILSHSEKEFIYLKRHLDPEWANEIKQLKIPGLFLQREYKRYYPLGEVMGQVLGFTNIDEKGQEGLELAYNSELRGIAGAKKVIKDRLGHVVADVASVRDPKPGRTLILTLDKRLQYLAYRSLKSAVALHRAKGGSVVILDSKTGDILAMVNQPSFNPNARVKGQPFQFRNRAVTDVYEPGSVMKIFSMASVLESKKFPMETSINTHPGWYRLGDHTVKDVHNYGTLNLTGIITKSSNVGISRLILAIPPEQFLGVFSKLGFGQATGVGFPGESSGVFDIKPRVHPFVLATVSFGYALSATPLQLARAYGALASGGCLRSPRFTKTSPVSPCEKVLLPETTQALIGMLKTVVEQGSGKKAAIPGYQVAGKTGTSKRVGRGGYEKRYNSLFVGITPLSGRRLVGVVVIEDPTDGQYYGSQVAAPVFSEVMNGALRVLGLPPDGVG